MKRTSRDFDYQWKQLPSNEIEFNEGRIKELLKLTKLSKKFFKGKKCLDAGCGSGRYTYAMKMLGADVTSFDISEEAIKICKTVNPNAYVFDIANLSEKRIFDFVFCWGVLHHTQNPRQSFSKVVSQVANEGLLHVMVYHKRYQYLYEEGRSGWNKWSTEERLEYCRVKVSKFGGDIHGWWDAHNPEYNFSYVPKQIKDWFKEENFRKIRLTKKANINMQGYFKGDKEV